MTERLLAFFKEFGEDFSLTPESDVIAVERALIYISLLTEFDKEDITKESIIERLVELTEEAIAKTDVVEEPAESEE